MAHASAEFSDVVDGFLPHPQQRADCYSTLGIWSNQPLWSIAMGSPSDAPAVSDAGRCLSVAELEDAARRRAAGLRSAGLQPGDRVVLQCTNSVALVINLLGLLRAGAVPVMTLPAHRITEIAHLAEVAGAVGYICQDRSAGFDYRHVAADLITRVPSVRFVWVEGDPGTFETPPDLDTDAGFGDDGAGYEADPDSPALFLVSGGTTGLPKLIPRTHNDYRYNVERASAATDLSARDTYLVVLPAAHNFPLACPGFLGALHVGAHVVLTDDPAPDSAFDLIEHHGVTVVALVPALAQVWTAATEWEPADLSSIRLIQVGGARLSEADARAILAAWPGRLQQVFGMAEGLICTTALDDDADAIVRAQVSPMSPLDEVRVVDAAGNEVDEGELLTRGPYTLRGYYRADDHNRRSFTPDGYYRSGDKVRRLASGRIAVTGRIKDTIVRAGENVAADDVEDLLLAHPAIHRVAVVGVPDSTLGERICAAVITDNAQLDLAEVRRFLLGRGVATFMIPDEVRHVSSLPVTAVGKVDKRAVVDALTCQG